MRLPKGARSTESGQAIILVILGMSMFLLGGVGLAIDGSNLYAQHRMAQAAADAAAQAGLMSIFDGTDSNTAATTYFPPGAQTCGVGTAHWASTPCQYASLNGFGSDTVTYNTAPGVVVPNLSSDTVNEFQVTVSRNVPTTLMRLLGSSATTIRATGTAAIVQVLSAPPLLITHPTKANALSNGKTITIQGGPKRSIQVNSNSTQDTFNGSYVLSGDFGNFGGPRTMPGGITFSSTGTYIDPSSPILDPFSAVPEPSVPATTPPANGQSCTVLGHCADCPAGGFSGSAPATCTEYLPGTYTGGIDLTHQGSVIFDPGVYYLAGGGMTSKLDTAAMCQSCALDPTTKNGLVIYDAGATPTATATTGFQFATQSNIAFLGAGITCATWANWQCTAISGNPVAPYYGIIFFEKREADAQTHSFGQGNGCFGFTGFIYIGNTLATMLADPTHYQEVDMQGTPCGAGSNLGGLDVNVLSLGGNASISMTLLQTPFINIRQVALVQ